ncbi:hypothetical protein HDU67_009410, partial [Dinochytrium kinnereticum]
MDAVDPLAILGTTLVDSTGKHAAKIISLIGSGSFAHVYLAEDALFSSPTSPTTTSATPYHATTSSPHASAMGGIIPSTPSPQSGSAPPSPTQGGGSQFGVGGAEDGAVAAPRRAVKRLFKKGLDARQLMLQRQEAAVMKALDGHNNIVRLLATVEDEECLYLIMEYCELDLYEAITQQGGFPEDVVKEVFGQIADAVLYCHSKGYYHRDLKPENCLISTSDYKIKLADFGLATTDNWSTEMGCGSVRYMAPECFEAGHNSTDPSTVHFGISGPDGQPIVGYNPAANDVWALGVILLNLLFGKNPWFEAFPTDAIFSAFSGPNPNILRQQFDLSPHFDAVLRRCFDLDPRRRCSITDLKIMVDSLPRFVGGGAAPPSPPVPNLVAVIHAAVGPPGCYGLVLPPGVPIPLNYPTPPPSRRMKLAASASATVTAATGTTTMTTGSMGSRPASVATTVNSSNNGTHRLSFMSWERSVASHMDEDSGAGVAVVSPLGGPVGSPGTVLNASAAAAVAAARRASAASGKYGSPVSPLSESSSVGGFVGGGGETERHHAAVVGREREQSPVRVRSPSGAAVSPPVSPAGGGGHWGGVRKQGSPETGGRRRRRGGGGGGDGMMTTTSTTTGVASDAEAMASVDPSPGRGVRRESGAMVMGGGEDEVGYRDSVRRRMHFDHADRMLGEVEGVGRVSMESSSLVVPCDGREEEEEEVVVVAAAAARETHPSSSLAALSSSTLSSPPPASASAPAPESAHHPPHHDHHHHHHHQHHSSTVTSATTTVTAMALSDSVGSTPSPVTESGSVIFRDDATLPAGVYRFDPKHVLAGEVGEGAAAAASAAAGGEERASPQRSVVSRTSLSLGRSKKPRPRSTPSSPYGFSGPLLGGGGGVATTTTTTTSSSLGRSHPLHPGRVMMAGAGVEGAGGGMAPGGVPARLVTVTGGGGVGRARDSGYDSGEAAAAAAAAAASAASAAAAVGTGAGAMGTVGGGGGGGGVGSLGRKAGTTSRRRAASDAVGGVRRGDEEGVLLGGVGAGVEEGGGGGVWRKRTGGAFSLRRSSHRNLRAMEEGGGGGGGGPVVVGRDDAVEAHVKRALDRFSVEDGAGSFSASSSSGGGGGAVGGEFVNASSANVMTTAAFPTTTTTTTTANASTASGRRRHFLSASPSLEKLRGAFGGGGHHHHHQQHQQSPTPPSTPPPEPAPVPLEVGGGETPPAVNRRSPSPRSWLFAPIMSREQVVSGGVVPKNSGRGPALGLGRFSGRRGATATATTAEGEGGATVTPPQPQPQASGLGAGFVGFVGMRRRFQGGGQQQQQQQALAGGLGGGGVRNSGGGRRSPRPGLGTSEQRAQFPPLSAGTSEDDTCCVNGHVARAAESDGLEQPQEGPTTTTTTTRSWSRNGSLRGVGVGVGVGKRPSALSLSALVSFGRSVKDLVTPRSRRGSMDSGMSGGRRSGAGAGAGGGAGGLKGQRSHPNLGGRDFDEVDETPT